VQRTKKIEWEEQGQAETRAMKRIKEDKAKKEDNMYRKRRRNRT
jgi:hypothetical protein